MLDKCPVCRQNNPRARVGGMTCFRCMRAVGLIKSRAGAAVSRLTASGAIPFARELKCVGCGKQASEYDHRHYARPADVIPVCRGCNWALGPADDLFRLARRLQQSGAMPKRRPWNKAVRQCVKNGSP